MIQSKTARSLQGNRVQKELEALREKQLAKSQRNKLKDVCSGPITNPEMAQAFLASMRDKQHQRDSNIHQYTAPPAHLSADGMDSWYLQQRQRERELRERRREAEALLRGYRGHGARESMGSVMTSSTSRYSMNPYYETHHTVDTNVDAADATMQEDYGGEDEYAEQGLRSTTSAASESLDDPRSFNYAKFRPFRPLRGQQEQPQQQEQQSLQQQSSDDFSDGQQYSIPSQSTMDDGEEKKSDSPRAIVGGHHHQQAKMAANPSELSEEVTVWLDFISSEPGAKFPPAPNRYHLYLSYACPGSHRALIARALKGLQDIVSVTYVHPTWRLTNPTDAEDKHRGWVFGNPDGEPFSNTIARGGPFPPAYEGNNPDPLFDAYSVREVYEQAGDTSGKYTIPVLWDTVHNTIVNNESSDIAYMMNSCFNEFALNPDLDLYTEYDEEGVAKLNEVSEWLSPLMIHGVYRCGFAKNQRAYDKAIAELCDAFDHADDILQRQRYLTGNDTLTDADIRLFVSLLRLDEVYAVYFKANARLVMLTPALLNFCREIYQLPGIAETCNMEQIKAHFFGSHAEWNKYSVIPRGLGFMELLDMPHDRHMLSDPEALLEIESNDEI